MTATKSSISVVMTCFAEGTLILDAIKSVHHQSLQPTKIIIVNDASLDATTIDVCRSLEQQQNIEVIWRSKNGGPSVARNDGFRAAQSDILVPLDADDLLPDRALEYIWETAIKNPEADFFYGNYLKQDTPEDTTIVNTNDISLSRMLRAKRFSLSSQWTLIGTAPIRKRLWQQLGECDSSLGVDDLHDLEFWIRAISTGCKYVYIPETIYVWRKYLGSNSRQVTPMSWYRIAEKHFDVYCQAGLEYRAYEQLLLGSQWLNQPDQIKIYRRKLLNCLLKGEFHFSSILALSIPGFLLRQLAVYLGRRR